MFVGSSDLERSKKFYDAVFAVLGVGPAQINNGKLFYSSPTGGFGVAIPINGEPVQHANGGTVSFRAASEEQANAWHAAGVANGGKSCEEPPGKRPHGAYLAYLRDPDGNKLCTLYR